MWRQQSSKSAIFFHHFLVGSTFSRKHNIAQWDCSMTTANCYCWYVLFRAIEFDIYCHLGTLFCQMALYQSMFYAVAGERSSPVIYSLFTLSATVCCRNMSGRQLLILRALRLRAPNIVKKIRE